MTSMDPARPGALADSAPPGVSGTFWELCIGEARADSVALDIGTGTGPVALGLAPRVRHVVGVDREGDAIADARRAAARASLSNVEFCVADVDAVEYDTLVPAPPALVTAHLFMSEAFVERASRVLQHGGTLVVLGFHVDQWKETGKVSRFAWDEARMRALLERCGLRVEHLSVEKDVKEFPSVEAALAAAIGMAEKWKSDGRWFRYIKFLEDGGRTLTRSHVIAKGRKT